jgi:hypothetical protein
MVESDERRVRMEGLLASSLALDGRTDEALD